MPTREEVNAIVEAIERLESLDPEARIRAMDGLDWSGFSEAEKRDVELRVTEGESPDFWLDGVQIEGESMQPDKFFTGTKTYEVWHREEGSHPKQSFPDGFIHVANVQANGLREVVDLTNDKGDFFSDPSSHQPWESSPGVHLVGVPDCGTTPGDVIVDPEKRPFRVEKEGFKEIERDDIDRVLLEVARHHNRDAQPGIER